MRKFNRYNFANATFGENLFKWSRQDEIGQSMGDDVDSVFAKIATYDPTKDSSSRFKFISWICKVIIQDNIKPEDVYKIRDNLQTFMSIRNRLPDNQHDIKNIPTSESLDDIVAPYQTGRVKSVRQIKKSEREQIDDETQFLYDGEDGKIIVPQTMRAAQFWGQGTKWCISAEKEEENLFESYHKDGPIVIIIFNGLEQSSGKFYQTKFAGHKRDRKLRDIRDKEIGHTLPLAIQKMLIQSGQLEFCMQKACLTPRHFDRQTFDEGAINKLLAAYVHPNDFYDGELSANNWRFAIRHQTPYMIMNVPEHLRTKDIYLEAARQSFTIIHMIDENLPYFEEIRYTAFENYQTSSGDADYKQIYRRWFEDLLAQKETGDQRPPALKCSL